MIRLTLLLAFFTLVFTFNACEYNSEDLLYPNAQVIDTNKTVSYSTDIVSILDARCTNCHNSQSVSGGINLDNYMDVKKNVDNGFLIGTIEWQSGYSRMPKGENQLPQNQRTLIDRWVNAGAPNN